MDETVKSFAEQLREFFAVLFGSRRIEDLKEQIADLKAQRDQAIAREQRLSLILLTPPVSRPTIQRPKDLVSVGRKTFAQIQREDWEQQKREAQQQEAAKKVEAS